MTTILTQSQAKLKVLFEELDTCIDNQHEVIRNSGNLERAMELPLFSRLLEQEERINLDIEKLERDAHQALAPDYNPNKEHHPECQCNTCYYGKDLATWAFNPGEY